MPPRPERVMVTRAPSPESRLISVVGMALFLITACGSAVRTNTAPQSRHAPIKTTSKS